MSFKLVEIELPSRAFDGKTISVKIPGGSTIRRIRRVGGVNKLVVRVPDGQSNLSECKLLIVKSDTAFDLAPGMRDLDSFELDAVLYHLIGPSELQGTQMDSN